MNPHRIKRFTFALLSITALYCQTALAQQQGMDTEIMYIGETTSNLSGGNKKDTAYLSTADISITLDTQKAGWWQDGTWFIEFLHNQGTNPSAFIGDMQAASNIADGKRTRLQQFWYQQTWGNNTSLLIGWHDLNSEFYVSEYSTLFLHSSFGIGPEISANVPTSLWPEAGFAVRLDIHSEHSYFHMAAYDGDPSTRHIDIRNEGLMWIAETAYLQGASTYKLGAWLHTADKIAPDGTQFSSDYGAYTIMDYALDNKLALFMQLGITPSDRNEVSSYMGLGLHIHELIRNRPNDVLGVAIARAGFSSLYQKVNGISAAETALEITYDMPIHHLLSIHPALQWIQHPSGNSALKAAYVAMLRIELHI